MPETGKAIIEEIKQAIDITSRIDERVKIVIEAQQKLIDKINLLVEEQGSHTNRLNTIESSNNEDRILRLKNKLDVIESLNSPKQQKFVQSVLIKFDNLTDEVVKLQNRIEELELNNKTWSNRVSTILSYLWQGTYVLCICYLLYKLGLNNPPIP